MTTEKRRPELLAPAGDKSAMHAAVQAGADAVYFGLKDFNARARATNFDTSGLEETMRYLHAHEVKGYVTINTLVFDQELPSIEIAIRACAQAGVDALLVQDLGVAKLVRAIAPQIPIHASTQMTCTDATSINFAKELGACRVILPRELSIQDIAAIKKDTNVELEAFIHGALCIAYSGQCLTSEAIGGRSANRGACAQACRLPYRLVVDGSVLDLGDCAHLLSPQDLESSDLIPELCELGLASLKIEGRLKGPAYVASTVQLYRSAIDSTLGTAPAPSNSQRDSALQTFSRGSGPAFLRGTNHQSLVDGKSCDHRGLEVGKVLRFVSQGARDLLILHTSRPISRGDGILLEGGFAGDGEIGGRIWNIQVDGQDLPCAPADADVEVWLGPDKRLSGNLANHRVFRSNDPSVEKEILQTIERSTFRIPLDFSLSGHLGEKPILRASSARGASAEIELDVALAEADKALDASTLRKQLEKLGDTPYGLAKVEVFIDAPTRLPPSSINRARRSLIEKLAQSSHPNYEVTETSVEKLLQDLPAPNQAIPPPGLFVLCRNADQARAAMDAGAAGVYLDFLNMVGLGAAVSELKSAKHFVAIAPPRIRKPGEEAIHKQILALAPDAILVRGLGALLDSHSIPKIGDFSLNVTNKISAQTVLSHGLLAFTPGFDLDAEQLTDLLDHNFAPFAELVVHHPVPLFHMEHCVIAARLSKGTDYRDCGRPCEKHALALRDRAAMDHPLEADVSCRNTIFHAASQSAAHLVPTLLRAGVRRYRIELVRETTEQTSQIISSYLALLSGKLSATDLTRTLRTEGGYGVVQGSLRMLTT